MLNLFLRELKVYRKNLVFWCIGIIILIVSGLAKFTAFQGDPKAIRDLMSQIPSTVQAIFGISGFDLTTIGRFYGVIFVYAALMATVHAVLIGTDLISKEERDKTSEFLFVKPISRIKIITAKIIAGLCNLAILNAVILVSSIFFVNYFGKGTGIDNNVYILMIGLLFMQVIFFFIGTATAAWVKRPKLSSSIATSALLSTFILSFVINVNTSLDPLKYLTPFKYFDAKVLMDTNQFDPIFLTLSSIIIVMSITLTYLNFTRRDLSV